MPHPTSWRSILILSFHLLPDLAGGLFLSPAPLSRQPVSFGWFLKSTSVWSGSYHFCLPSAAYRTTFFSHSPVPQQPISSLRHLIDGVSRSYTDTPHSCILLWFMVNDQINAQFFSMYLFQFSTCFEQPPCSSSGGSIVSIQHLVYVTLCRWPFRVFSFCMFFIPDGCTVLVLFCFDVHAFVYLFCFFCIANTKRSPTHSDIYQILYWYNWSSWWWARVCSKHVE